MAEELFLEVFADLGVAINYSPEGQDPTPSIFDYVEAMRCQSRATACFREFHEAD